MSLLWTTAMAVEAMPWEVHPGEEEMAGDAKPVKQAGFAGYVTSPVMHKLHMKTEQPFNHKVWNEVEPEPEDHDFHHFEQHGEFSPEHAKRHQQAYDEAMAKERAHDIPDHFDSELTHFQRSSARFADTWHKFGTHGPVDIKNKPVYATQSHVNQQHVNRYIKDAGDKSWFEQMGGHDDGQYVGNKAPMLVTHKGRLHVIEGHHRVAAAIQRGDSHIHGWHFNMDEHGSSPGLTEDNWKS